MCPETHKRPRSSHFNTGVGPSSGISHTCITHPMLEKLKVHLYPQLSVQDHLKPRDPLAAASSDPE